MSVVEIKEKKKKWSERQDLNLRRLGPKPSALARLSYAPTGTEYPTTARFRNDFPFFDQTLRDSGGPRIRVKKAN
jgi:hypothetical protein